MANFRINDGVVVDYTNEGWGEFKKWLDGTYASLLYAWVDEGEAYSIVAADGPFYRTFSINKTDATDFEANWKTTTPKPIVPRTPAGVPYSAADNLVLGQAAFIRTDDATQLMNVDGRAGGSVTPIWNGDDTAWTRSGVGTVTTQSAHSGTNGLDTGVMSNDDPVVFTNSVDIDPEDFSEVSFWLQPKVVLGNAQPRIRWATVADSNEGNELDLEDYVTNFDLDVWQKVTIPMADFNINPADDVGKLKFKFHNSGQHFWIDDVELQAGGGGGGPFVYRIAAPDAVTRYHISMLVLVVSGAGSGWNQNTFANAAALTNGLLLRQRRLSDSNVMWSLNSRDNHDLFGRFHPQDDITFSNGVLLVGFMVKPGKASILITDDDVLEFVVRDDLSVLSSARAFAHYGVEDVS